MFRKIVSEANEGMNIGLLVAGVDRGKLNREDILVKPQNED